MGIPHFMQSVPSALASRLAICSIAALLAGGCATPLQPAPVEHRDTNVALPPIIDGGLRRDGDTAQAPWVGAADARTADSGGASSGPLDQAPPVANPPQSEPADPATADGVVVESAAIETGRIDARPLAGDVAAAGSVPAAREGAPVITMAPEIGPAPRPGDGASAPPAVVAVTPPPGPAASDPPGVGAATGGAVAGAAGGDAGRAFIWPAKGAVTKSFTDPKSMGIAIAGKAGDPVSAVADGRVIFSGLGPRGYGRLLIVKHADELLSVYANNRTLLVKEGDTVRQGERIAELGSSGTDAPRLHFEIRRLGKPVDPISYLPPRLQ